MSPDKKKFKLEVSNRKIAVMVPDVGDKAVPFCITYKSKKRSKEKF